MNYFFALMGGLFVGAFMANILGLGFLYGLLTAVLAGMLINQLLNRKVGTAKRPRPRPSARRPRPENSGPRRPVGGRGRRLGPFTISLVVLAAKMAKADGRVTTDAIRAFRRVVDIPPDHEATIAEIFNEAKKTAQGYEPYAINLRDAVLGDPAILRQVLTCLHEVAAADGPISESERHFLAGVEHIFSLGARRAGGGPWSQGGQGRTSGHQGRAGGTGQARPESAHAVLGLPRDATVAQIKAAYRELARKHHPDYLQSQGLSRPMIDAAHEEMVRINAAYDELKTSKGFR